MKKRHSQRGYTLVELMMAVALFAVAVLGIISMQKVTITSNAHARNVAVAQRIAQAWAGQLQLDSTEWVTTFGSGFLNSAAVWQRPAYNTTRTFGAAFDGLGNPLANADLAKARFCSHVRMSWLYPNTMPNTGNGVLRAEIRVFWLRDSETPIDNITGSLCSAGQSNAQVQAIGLATDVYHFVYQTVGVRQSSRI